MIDFKNKDELPTNIVICGSLAILVIAAGCIVLLPKPVAPSAKANRAAQSKIKAATIAMQQQIATERATLSKQTWQGNQEDIAPVALKQVNALIQNRHLKLVGFHAQKPVEEPNITLIPFVVSVDGPFTSVMAFTRDIEKPGTKFAVNLFQVSNADQASDKVTASIGITAYQLPQVAAPTPTPSTSTPAKPTKPAKEVKKNA